MVMTGAAAASSSRDHHHQPPTRHHHPQRGVARVRDERQMQQRHPAMVHGRGVRRYPQRRSVGGGGVVGGTGTNNNNNLPGFAHANDGGCPSVIPDWIEVAGADESAGDADDVARARRVGEGGEAELRRGAHLHCRLALERTFRRAFADAHASVLEDVRSFCCHRRGRVATSGRKRKRNRDGSGTAGGADDVGDDGPGLPTPPPPPPPPPHPSILPLAVVRVAPPLTDRSHLVRHLSDADAAVLGPRVRVCPLRAGRWCGVGVGGGGGGGTSSISLADVMRRLALRCLLPSPSPHSPHGKDIGDDGAEEKEESRTDDVDDDDEADVNAALLDFMERRWGTSRGSSVSVRESMEVILHWAGNTGRYDGLAVVLEDSEVLPPVVLDGLIACLRTLRSRRGLPVSLVVVVSSGACGGGGSSSLPSTLSGSSLDGVMVREFAAPDPAGVVDIFLDGLMDADRGGGGPDTEADMFSAMLSPELLEKSRLSFRRDHRSAVTFLCHLKMALANLFSQSGSFVVALHSSSFRQRHGRAAQRGLASLRHNVPFVRKVTGRRDGRPVLIKDIERWLKMSLLRRRCIADVYAILKVAAQFLTSSGHSSSLSVEDLGGVSCPTQLLLGVLQSPGDGSVVLQEVCDMMKVAPPLTIVTLLKEWKVILKKRQKLRGFEKADADRDDYDFSNIFPEGSAPDTLKSFLLGIDELIVLYGEFLKMQEHEEYAGTSEAQSVKTDLSLDMVCWFQGQMKGWLEPLPEVDECVERFIQFLHIRFPETSVQSESRRTVAVALGGYHMDEDENGTDSCVAFVAMRGDRVISCSHWYGRFCARVKARKLVAKSEVGEGTMWQRFAFAVYELEACGLVARKGGCKKEEVFEKRAMVWASGKLD